MSSSTPLIIGQRDAYLEALFPIFQQDKNCVFITADNGAPSLDQYRDLPAGQYYQVGIAEQAAVTIATGLALEGKRVFVYAIAPFLTVRILEFVKLDMCAMNLPITLLGVGAGVAYDNMGPSHHTLEDISIMRALPGLEIYSPADSVCAAALAKLSYERPGPKYIRFDRAGVPNIHSDINASGEAVDWDRYGLAVAHNEIDSKIVIAATGIAVHQAVAAAKELLTHRITAQVLDIYRIAPFPWDTFSKLTGGTPIVTLEEHFLPGGLGSIVSEALHDAGMTNRLLRIGMPHEFVFTYGGREHIWKTVGLDVDSIVRRIKEWL